MDFEKEIKVEKNLRSVKILIPIITLITGSLLILALYLLMIAFDKGNYWLLLPSGIVLHAVMIVVVHEGAHNAITRNTNMDSVIINILSGIVMIPVYAEFFRKYHLIHHAHTNAPVDPLWPDEKRWLFENHKRIFVIVELIPVLTTIVLLFLGEKKRKKTIRGPKVRWYFMALSVMVSVLVGWFFQPTLMFVVGTVLMAGIVAKIRNWCEHTGRDLSKLSNTYWFPLGMGIGNHEAHHALPRISWVTNQYCLFFKKRDTNPLTTTYGMILDKNHKHYPPEN